MAGVRRVSNKATPAKSAKKHLRQELRSLFLKSRSSFYRTKNLAAITKIVRAKKSLFYKALRSRALKTQATFFPKSNILVPFESSLSPLFGF